MRRAVVILALGFVTGGAGAGVWQWIRSRDDVYDDEREIAKYAANPPREVTVPADVSLPVVAKASPVNPALLDIALGKTTLRVHGRVALAAPDDAAAGFGPRHASGLYLTEVGPMVAWGRKLNDAVDASRYEVNLLVDEDATYREVVELLYTLGQQELSDVHLVVRTPSGMGALRVAPSAVGGGPVLSHAVCILPDGIKLESSGSSRTPVHSLGCGWSGAGFDAAAYKACFRKIEGHDLDAPPAPLITVRATAAVRFGRAVMVEAALTDLGLAPGWGTPCDDP